MRAGTSSADMPTSALSSGSGHTLHRSVEAGKEVPLLPQEGLQPNGGIILLRQCCPQHRICYKIRYTCVSVHDIACLIGHHSTTRSLRCLLPWSVKQVDVPGKDHPRL